MAEEVVKKALKGGEFLIRETKAQEVFIPEEFSEEAHMIAQTCYGFIKEEVIPKIQQIDALEEGLMPSLIQKSGDLGLLGASVPEDLGGMNVNFPISLLIAEAMGGAYSFSVAFTAHTGIGTLPILYYGNEAQKKKYIPKLASGEWKSAYCLTEPSSGSDANSGKTKAVLSADGKHYILNGQKMWITNAGFADIFTVFAKIDDDQNLSAFIVEKDYPGITLNAEEKKMGIKGSSTRQVFFNEVKVPVENLLSTRGNGFKIALNILNIGRIKLGAGVLGGAKDAIRLSIKYALEREQFGRPIAKYGAIKTKIGEQVIKSYILESAVYRAGQNIDDAIASYVSEGKPEAEAILKGIEQFAPECALLKVLGSEVLDFVVDEGVQIHGGMGFSAESMIERAYRDSRINRIFEGTNEINRMLLVEMVLKRAMKGELDLMTPAMAVGKELMAVPNMGATVSNDLEKYRVYIASFKKAILLVAGAAVQKLMNTLQKEQEVLMHIADMCIQLYGIESTFLRLEKLQQMGKNVDNVWAVLKVGTEEAAQIIASKGREAIAHFAQADEAKMMLIGLNRFTKTDAVDVIALKRQIADISLAKGGYTV